MKSLMLVFSSILFVAQFVFVPAWGQDAVKTENTVTVNLSDVTEAAVTEDEDDAELPPDILKDTIADYTKQMEQNRNKEELLRLEENLKPWYESTEIAQETMTAEDIDWLIAEVTKSRKAVEEAEKNNPNPSDEFVTLGTFDSMASSFQKNLEKAGSNIKKEAKKAGTKISNDAKKQTDKSINNAKKQLNDSRKNVEKQAKKSGEKVQKTVTKKVTDGIKKVEKTGTKEIKKTEKAASKKIKEGEKAVIDLINGNKKTPTKKSGTSTSKSNSKSSNTSSGKKSSSSKKK